MPRSNCGTNCQKRYICRRFPSMELIFGIQGTNWHYASVSVPESHLCTARTTGTRVSSHIAVSNCAVPIMRVS